MCFTKHYINYTSDVTQFIIKLKEQNPNLEEQQLAGRKLLWDQAPINLDQIARDEESKVKQQPYVYQDY